MISKLPWRIRKHFIEDDDGNTIININDLPNDIEDSYLIVESINEHKQLKNKYNLCLKELDKLYKENEKLKENNKELLDMLVKIAYCGWNMNELHNLMVKYGYEEED